MLAFRLSLLICALALEATAQITDSHGVVLIDQQHALVGGIGPDDASGFPVTISSPGSYKLTSNLTVRDLNTTAIEIKADNVTLDLNGFNITGPNVCPLPGAGKCANGSGNGVYALDRAGITVKNGMITGMGNSGVFFPGGGNSVGNAVRNVTASHNGIHGIFVASGSAISDSLATRNGDAGISCGNSLVTRNVSISNGANGLLGVLHCAFSGNVFVGNGGAPVVGGLNLGQNSCNGAVCP